MGKKDFLPKDMRDLEDIFYNPANSERKLKYESHTDVKVLDKVRESEARRVMSGFGESIKIPTVAGTRKPDFWIVKSKIVYEITSIQWSEDERKAQRVRPRSEEDIIRDLNSAIEHALEKDYSEYKKYLKGAIVVIDVALSALCSYTEVCALPDIVKKTKFKESEIDFLIIVPHPSSISNAMPYTAYTKTEKLAQVFVEKLPTEFKVFSI